MLPLLFVAAFSLDSGPRDGGANAGTRPVDLATGGAPNFTIFVLLVSGELLLYIVAALLAGDPVPAEASWSSPALSPHGPGGSRAWLLTSKLVVGLLSLAVAVVVLAVWALLVGWIAYGTAVFTTIPGGGTMPGAPSCPGWPSCCPICLSRSCRLQPSPSGWGRTDTPLAAVGAALIAYIVAGILDSIDALGDWRRRARALLQGVDLLYSSDPDWSAMRHGVLVPALCGALRRHRLPPLRPQGRPCPDGVRPAHSPTARGLRSRPCARGRTTRSPSRGGSGLLHPAPITGGAWLRCRVPVGALVTVTRSAAPRPVTDTDHPGSSLTRLHRAQRPLPVWKPVEPPAGVLSHGRHAERVHRTTGWRRRHRAGESWSEAPSEVPCPALHRHGSRPLGVVKSRLTRASTAGSARRAQTCPAVGNARK